MKQKFLLFVCTVFAGAALVSCSKDDDGDGGSSASIVGKWEFYKQTEYAGGQVIDEYLWDNLCSTKKDYVQFESNGDFLMVSYDEDCDPENEAATYSISGDNLTIDYGTGEIFSSKIITLTSSKLIIEDEEDWGGVTYTYRIELRK